MEGRPHGRIGARGFSGGGRAKGIYCPPGFASRGRPTTDFNFQDSMGLFRDLVTLTKPRVVSLLLLTTIAPMFLTDRGLPRLALVGWVLLAGYLMAGGANAINMWFDRDIDTAMPRTRLRPIPSGRLPAGAALLFGIGLGLASFALFWRFVTPLAAR